MFVNLKTHFAGAVALAICASAAAETILYDFETAAERTAVPRVSNGEFEVGVTNGFATSGDFLEGAH